METNIRLEDLGYNDKLEEFRLKQKLMNLR